MEFEGVVYRKMATFIRSCCFIITSSFIWFFNLASLHLFFRFRIKESNPPKHDLKPCDDDDKDEKDSPRFIFKFRHQLTHDHEEACNFQKNSSGFMKEIDQNSSFSSLIDGQRLNLNASRTIEHEKSEFSGFHSAGDRCSVKEILSEEIQQQRFNGARRTEDERLEFNEARDFCSIDDLEKEREKFLSDAEFSLSDSDTVSLSMSDDGYSVKELTADSDSDGFFSEGDTDAESGFKVIEPDELQMELTDSSESEKSSAGDTISFISSPEVSDDALRGDESGDESDDEEDDDDAADELESLLGELNLMKELRKETKRLRAINLPIITEESVAPKMARDLRPWKTEKSNDGDAADELHHQFYRIYRERMKKLDTLNYQKMNTVGLQYYLQSVGEQTKYSSLIPAIKSRLLSHNLLGRCTLTTGVDDDQNERRMRELQSDLETVYVGQTCLSWEWLRWQYEMLLQFDEDEDSTDECRIHNRYNEVAGEFQQFQAILQRFMEDEMTRGPRLPNYVRNRFLLQNLLQVPLLREDDGLKEVGDESKGKCIITREILADMMEESIWLFSEFVRAEKDEIPGILRAFVGPHVQLQDPADSKLMAEVKSSLHKKENRLRDIVRTGNCLVNKLKKPKQVRLEGHALFSQVDLKLVSRVLRMSRVTTQQLIWCHSKLSTISFADAKICREPSLLLFPC